MNQNTLNTTNALQTAVAALPDDIEIGMVLGLDGDCDFTRRVTDYYAYQSGKQDLLQLIAAQPDGELPYMFRNHEYLVLGRRHAVYLPDIQTARAPALAM